MTVLKDEVKDNDHGWFKAAFENVLLKKCKDKKKFLRFGTTCLRVFRTMMLNKFVLDFETVYLLLKL